MKKFILLLVCCSLFGGAEAQESTPVKEKLVIDYFNYEPEMSIIYVEMLRDGVRRGFMTRGRHEVVDAAKIAGMRVTPEMMYQSPDLGLLHQTRIAACYDSGARWLVWGDISEYVSRMEMVAGKKQFTNSIILTLGGMDVLSGETLPAESIQLSGNGRDNVEAKKQMIASLSMRIESYINKYYKFNASILHIEPANNKGKYKELYINCGTNMGLRSGDLFMVYRMDEANGMMLPHQIGKIRVHEINGPQMALCTISNGGEEIAAAVNAGLTVVAQSAGESFF